ncbi:hypothetical protein LPJ53_005719 [Coemansia erecta]|uniref:Fungal lipase-type domain-containing protein n=1 Tax=Coemansia erecta TaxID=147472 RepID=A0A9W7XV28_9FUNG|nr:hypothetical protein LPJ53_005719 [Coemansia erecta]
MKIPLNLVNFYTTASTLLGNQDSYVAEHQLQPLPQVELSSLEHWGHYAAATYQRFEDWSACTACQFTDIRSSVLNATWSTALPAFSRGYVAIQEERREITVAFRGTTHIMDALSDVQLLQSPWPADRRSGSRVHTGFLLAYLSARPHVLGALERISADPMYAEYSLCFVGHSLGGAQATLAYIDYMSRFEKAQLILPRLVTFGAPRVGNAQFAALVGGSSPKSGESLDALRVVHEMDIVPHLPRSLYPGHYVHSDREVWARDGDSGNSTELILCQPSSSPDGDPGCSSGTSPLQWSIRDHMVYPGMQLGIPEY